MSRFVVNSKNPKTFYYLPPIVCNSLWTWFARISFEYTRFFDKMLYFISSEDMSPQLSLFSEDLGKFH